MILIVGSLRDYCLETHFDIQMVDRLALMKASNLDYLMVKCLALYFET